jgi:hypothetical protein
VGALVDGRESTEICGWGVDGCGASAFPRQCCSVARERTYRMFADVVVTGEDIGVAYQCQLLQIRVCNGPVQIFTGDEGILELLLVDRLSLSLSLPDLPGLRLLSRLLLSDLPPPRMCAAATRRDSERAGVRITPLIIMALRVNSTIAWKDVTWSVPTMAAMRFLKLG